MNTLPSTMLAGAALMASFYANAAASMESLNARDDDSHKMIQRLGFEETEGVDHLYLANIKQRSTNDLAKRLQGKSIEEIETIANGLGYDIEWVNA